MGEINGAECSECASVLTYSDEVDIYICRKCNALYIYNRMESIQ